MEELSVLDKNINKKKDDAQFVATTGDEFIKFYFNGFIMKKLNSAFPILETILVSFKLYSNKTKQDLSYGMGFIYNLDVLPKFNSKIAYLESFRYMNYVFLQMSISPSYSSCDGEYRDSLFMYKTYKKIIENNYDVITDISNNLMKKINKDGITLFTELYSNDNKVININIDRIIYTEMIPLNMLCILWLQLLHTKKYNKTPNNINDKYEEILFEQDDMEFFDLIEKKYSQKIDEIISKIYKKKVTTSKTMKLNTGIKMVPLNINDIKFSYDIRSKAWRELIVNKKLNILLCSGVSIHFPFLTSYCIIHNSNKNLYDNKSQYEKIKNSEIASGILKNLENAQKGTYFATLANKDILKSDIKKWINNKFKKLNKIIEMPINYILDEISISDKSLFIINENKGITILDFLFNCKENDKFHNTHKNCLYDSGYNYFVKLIFELCYDLYCMFKLHIFHGDLHLNNATFHDIFNESKEHISYKIKDKEYTFKITEGIVNLIDFSRAIINPEYYDTFRDEIIVTITSDYEETFRIEVDNLYNLFINNFPEREREKMKIKELIEKDFSLMFNVFSGLDLYTFMIRINKVLVTFENDGFKIGKKIFDFVNKIIQTTETIMLTKLDDLIANYNMYEKQFKEENSLCEIIEKCFSDFVDLNISNIYITFDAEKEMKATEAEYINKSYAYEHFSQVINYIENNQKEAYSILKQISKDYVYNV